MAGECSTGAGRGHLLADGDLVGLLCARCGSVFRGGEALRAIDVLIVHADGAAQRQVILAHHDCADPGMDRVRH